MPFRQLPYLIFHTKIFAANQSQILLFSEGLIKYLSSLKNCDITYKNEIKNKKNKINDEINDE